MESRDSCAPCVQSGLRSAWLTSGLGHIVAIQAHDNAAGGLATDVEVKEHLLGDGRWVVHSGHGAHRGELRKSCRLWSARLGQRQHSLTVSMPDIPGEQPWSSEASRASGKQRNPVRKQCNQISSSACDFTKAWWLICRSTAATQQRSVRIIYDGTGILTAIIS